jgi:hypothetical protein
LWAHGIPELELALLDDEAPPAPLLVELDVEVEVEVLDVEVEVLVEDVLVDVLLVEAPPLPLLDVMPLEVEPLVVVPLPPTPPLAPKMPLSELAEHAAASPAPRTPVKAIRIQARYFMIVSSRGDPRPAYYRGNAMTASTQRPDEER